ncbi:NADH-quinone oxidoreductase subunit C [Kineosporia babensis]|uniref:NADH-quinone oxidoreductase subunit C n=1 Tax=Kineosporia babensis TaxID=499548 RepID=A0A9X1NFZ3_9ACTN|nr:NADH-quinone oxidoreductase subunit C [Kineosporia babensis]MCD5313111.1 NADH-quinone oxidoreductase subunit C [Kineosporia babensis]
MSAPDARPHGTRDANQLMAWFSAALLEAGVEDATGRPSGNQPNGDSSEAAAPLLQVSADAAGTPVVDVPAAGWVAAATCARDQLGLDFLDWLSAVDEPEGDPPGLDVVLHLAATDSFATPDRSVRRILLRTRVANTALSLPSLTALWPGVAWHERETFEMFGLTFTGFDDATAAGLRPLLLPDGFEGTPLRKSFVLAARAAKAWPGAKDPGDSGAKPARRKNLPPGVPDASWGPHEPGAHSGEEAAQPRPASAAGKPATSSSDSPEGQA